MDEATAIDASVAICPQPDLPGAPPPEPGSTWFSIDTDISLGGEPTGEWLYGADMSTHPDFRQKGLASLLYQARRDLIKQLNLRGMVGGGMVPGYRFHKDQMSLEEYAAKVSRGELKDPTLTPQLKNGYEVRGIIRDYLHDELLGNDATLIVYDNPDYRP